MNRKTSAVVFEKPQSLRIACLGLEEPGDADVVVDIDWSGISTGTERLLWNGEMPSFPGLGYPLVPGYESVGRISHAGSMSGRSIGERVFVPGARCFKEARGLFGGAAATLVVPGSKVTAIGDSLGEQGVLLALAATAHHAVCAPKILPQLIVGHGVLGRLSARVAAALGASPIVWETNASRRDGACGYDVIDPSADTRRDYSSVCDVSGDAGILNALIARLAPKGEIVLAGFYHAPLNFDFAPAFMREARICVAAEWREADLAAVLSLIESGRLRLDGLITHRAAAADAEHAYPKAFADSQCLKMILDWRECP